MKGITIINSIKIEKEEIPLIEVLDISNLKEKFDEYQLEVDYEIKNIKSEDFVKKIYEKKGYMVIKVSSDGSYVDALFHNIESISFEERKKLIENIVKYIKDKFNIQYESLMTMGVPDFLVLKIEKNEVIDLFFCEVKTDRLNLSFTQEEWLFNNGAIPYKIIIVHKKGEL